MAPEACDGCIPLNEPFFAITKSADAEEELRRFCERKYFEETPEEVLYSERFLRIVLCRRSFGSAVALLALVVAATAKALGCSTVFSVLSSCGFLGEEFSKSTSGTGVCASSSAELFGVDRALSTDLPTAGSRLLSVGSMGRVLPSLEAVS